jgi:hypothetical protein
VKVIQSFAQYSTGSPYLNNELKGMEVYLNFYSFLLSYLTLKKWYGSVTMYTNQLGYDTLIKYIPYDEVIIKENKNEGLYWNVYKLESIENTNGDVIHVDSDVFVFNDLFRPFYEGDYDLMVQDIITPQRNDHFTGCFMKDNGLLLNKMNILDINKYDGRCFSCGVLGIKNEVKGSYLDMVSTLKTNIDNKIFKLEERLYAPVSEELCLYLTSLKHNMKVYSILPYDDIICNYGNPNPVGNKYGYTHLLAKTKFFEKNITRIKNKILKLFPDQYSIVKKYEVELKRKKIKLIYL